MALDRAIDFLIRIGMDVARVQAVPRGSFVPNIRIVAGRLEVASGCRPSNLLHEAGHLACVPTQFRPWMTGNLATGQRRMCEAVAAMDLEPDAPLLRAVLQCSDPEATAWAWAAGTHLGLSPEAIIPDQDYGGDGAEIRACLQMKAYIGINGMMHAGLCAAPRAGGYPVMRKWLQDAAA